MLTRLVGEGAFQRTTSISSRNVAWTMRPRQRRNWKLCLDDPLTL